MSTEATTAPSAGSDEAVQGPGETGRPGARPMRADAVKNRARILEAAEEIFATEGVSVPIDMVADRAGLGVGTLYRHFPTKEALFEAIVVARLQDLLELGRAQQQAADPGAAMFDFLRQFSRQASAKRDLFEALSSAGFDIKSQCAELMDEMKQNIDALRRRAVAAGALRPDVSTDEMVGLVMGACEAGGHTGTDAAGLARLVEIVCDGLRSPMSGPAAT